MIDLNSKSHFSYRVNDFIDNAIAKESELSVPRKYLGASVVGHYCERHVQYHLIAARGHLTKTRPEPRISRIFDRGNTYEFKVKNWMMKAGFVFGTRFDSTLSFTDFKDEFKGHVDGVIIGWKISNACPVMLPALWECKCLGSKGWKTLEKNKLREAYPVYFAQVQIYMHYTKLERCLFVAINADTMELYHEVIERNEMEITLILSRVRSVFESTDDGKLLPRCTGDKNYHICKICEFSEECWKDK